MTRTHPNSSGRHLALALALGAVSMITAHAGAAVIAQYTFATNDNSSDTQPDSTAFPFVYAGGGVRSTSTLSAVQTYANIASTDEASAVANSDYFAFTVEPAAGFQLDLTNLTFTTQVKVGSGTLAGTFFVRSSLDSFAGNLASYEMNNVTTKDPRDLPLSGPQFQGLNTAIEFRIYIYETVTSTTTFDAMRVDDVVLNGDVTVVPEPLTATLLLGTGLLGLLNRPRRAT